jgi:hypothetical protein
MSDILSSIDIWQQPEPQRADPMIPFRDLKCLPYETLKFIALALARDIDQGHDKRDLLEKIFGAIAYNYR